MVTIPSHGVVYGIVLSTVEVYEIGHTTSNEMVFIMLIMARTWLCNWVHPKMTQNWLL